MTLRLDQDVNTLPNLNLSLTSETTTIQMVDTQAQWPLHLHAIQVSVLVKGFKISEYFSVRDPIGRMVRVRSDVILYLLSYVMLSVFSDQIMENSSNNNNFQLVLYTRQWANPQVVCLHSWKSD